MECGRGLFRPATALVRLHCALVGRKGMVQLSLVRICGEPLWIITNTVSAGCQRRLPTISICLQSAGHRTTAPICHTEHQRRISRPITKNPTSHTQTLHNQSTGLQSQPVYCRDSPRGCPGGGDGLSAGMGCVTAQYPISPSNALATTLYPFLVA